MTVASGTAVRVEAAGDGSTVAFSFAFKVYTQDEILVYKLNSTTRVATLQTFGTDYDLSINGVDNTTTTDGGTVTYAIAPTASEISLILSNYNYAQPSELPRSAPMLMSRVESVADRQTYIAKQVAERIGRSMKLPEGTDISSFDLPPPTASRGLIWNDDGDALQNSAIDPDTLAASPIAIPVVKTEMTNFFSVTVATGVFSEITGLSASITPTSTNSRILVILSIDSSSSSDDNLVYLLSRNGAGIHDSTSSEAGSRTRGSLANRTDSGAEMMGYSFAFIDSPASTSEQTYTVGVTSLAATPTVYINRAATDGDTSSNMCSSSSICLVELFGT